MSLHESYDSDCDISSINSSNSVNIDSVNSVNSIDSINSLNSNNINSLNSNNINSINSNTSIGSTIKSNNYQQSITSSDINSENVDYFFTYKSSIVPVTLEDLNMFENNCINIGVLSNYYDKKDDSKFSPLYLPEISITYNSLIKLFFNCSGKNFTPFILNKIWNSVRGLNLVNEFLKVFEKKTELNRNDLSTVSKIKLYKECSFSSITTKASKIFALNFDELNNTLSSGQYRDDGKIYVSINFLLYSETLEIGVNIMLPLLLSNVQNSLYINSNESSVLFDFDSSSSVSCNSINL
jgi:hypothetical protein